MSGGHWDNEKLGFNFYLKYFWSDWVWRSALAWVLLSFHEFSWKNAEKNPFFEGEYSESTPTRSRPCHSLKFPNFQSWPSEQQCRLLTRVDSDGRIFKSFKFPALGSKSPSLVSLSHYCRVNEGECNWSAQKDQLTFTVGQTSWPVNWGHPDLYSTQTVSWLTNHGGVLNFISSNFGFNLLALLEIDRYSHRSLISGF